MTLIGRNSASPSSRTAPSAAPAEKQPVPTPGALVTPPTTEVRADGFEKSGAARSGPANKLLGGIFGGGDKKYDGVLVGAKGATFPPGTPLNQVPGVTPRNNAQPTETLLYVNGINNNKDTQFASMQKLADRTGAKVIGVHNATEGMIADLAQCVNDKLDKGKNPAVDTMADTVYSELKAGRGVHLMAHSQGALVTSRALNDVANRLRIEDGLSSAQVEKAMSKIKVETFGGAAAHFPDGPQYVHYVNKNDIVPTWFGQGDGDGVDEWARDGGKGAVIRRFEQGSGIDGTHSFDNVYLQQRVPFEQARAGR
ncbi:hypothetical protein CYFUS_000346 [Cystobacter fuscus]|uniref:DUF676 domain-containing protein n=1 Tax=Cystobacter fuscus TaxID=43 RepID=A0A250IT64_9BACT|nr:hypothetical protein [Cystobacter fuscus]ATB34934.1 hypothetical protein CYFUS_000346 [Cystobacter fuscus]